MTIVWWIVIGVIAGWITGKIMKGSGYGFWVDMLIGIGGAVVGGFIAGRLGFASSGGLIYTLIIAVLGAILLVFLFRLVTGKRG
ncbi:MAG TPA: GlsB/YeaQ/YmgE family stress response membrane protein [Terracidiphilus sp.]|nr:GlsB/YeaQ/YmgE family stress response membrane protein [Terracidiphilus sp.]